MVFKGVRDIRLLAFAVAVIVYGLAGSPTPDNFGIAEIVTGLCLIIAAGAPGAWQFFRGSHSLWQRAGLLLALYALTIPLIMGAVSGHGLALILRDVIPFLFLLMPFILWPFVKNRIQHAYFLFGLIAFSGFAFAARLLMQGQGAHLPVVDPLYLANAPTVLFAAILMLGVAGWQVTRGLSARRVLAAAILSTLAVIPLLAMVAITQRATIGVLILALVLLLAIGFYRYGARALAPAFAAFAVLLLLWVPVSLHLESLLLKTSLVGLNNRMQEFRAVLGMQDTFLAVLFGHGWGQTVVSPAAGGVPVNFTHNLFTALWLKTGLVGAGLCLVFLAGLAWDALRGFWQNPVVLTALMGPLLISVTLYASYKSLDFGLILTGLALVAARANESCTKPPARV